MEFAAKEMGAIIATSRRRRWCVGVIGLGTMGRRIAEAMRMHPRFDVVLGCDPRLQSCDWIRLASNAEELLADDRVECVYVATPPGGHEALIQLCVKARKSLFCEKPLAPDSAAASRCASLVERCALPSAVNFPFASAANLVRLGELVRQHALGPVTRATLALRFARWPRDWQRAGSSWLGSPIEGGFMREVGSHFVFAMHRLFGEGRVVSAQVERDSLGLETRVDARIRFTSFEWNIQARVAGAEADYNRLELVGRRSSAVVSGWYDLSHRGEVLRGSPPDARQLDALADLLDGRPSRLATFREAAVVASTVDAILGK